MSAHGARPPWNEHVIVPRCERQRASKDAEAGQRPSETRIPRGSDFARAPQDDDALLPSPRSASDGFILVTVLWILGALAALVSVYAVYVANTAMAAAVRDDGLAAQGLVTAAVELAAHQITSIPRDSRPTHGALAFRMSRADVAVTFRDEAARIDLNAAPRELLAGLFATLGARPEAADHHADRIVAWRAPASGDTPEGEATLYRDSGLDYGPRGAPFVHVEELWLVTGLPPALVERALPHLTVYSGRPEVNEREADPVVLASLPGPSPKRPAAAAPADAPADADGAAPAAGAATEAGDAVRVTVRIAFGNGSVRGAEAVILVRDFGDDPYRVLSWCEDIDVETDMSAGMAARRRQGEARR